MWGPQGWCPALSYALAVISLCCQENTHAANLPDLPARRSLRAACKGSLIDVQQIRWSMYDFERATLQESFPPNVSFRHCRQGHCAKVPPTFLNSRSRDVYFPQSVAALKGSRSQPAEICWEINPFYPCPKEATFWRPDAGLADYTLPFPYQSFSRCVARRLER